MRSTESSMSKARNAVAKSGPTLESIHDLALRLSHDDRIEPIEWAAEIERRCDEIDVGTAKLVHWSEVRAMLEKDAADARNRSARRGKARAARGTRLVSGKRSQSRRAV